MHCKYSIVHIYYCDSFTNVNIYCFYICTTHKKINVVRKEINIILTSVISDIFKIGKQKKIYIRSCMHDSGFHVAFQNNFFQLNIFY